MTREVYVPVFAGNPDVDDGHFDFYPVQALPLDCEILSSHLQKSVWFASLDRCRLEVQGTVLRMLENPRRHYWPPSDFDIQKVIKESQSEVRGIVADLGRVKNMLQFALDKLRKNPGYLIPENRVLELNAMEKKIPQVEARHAGQPFVAYFETTLAMVGGNTTQQYLQSYMQLVLFLEKQLQFFSQILSVASTPAQKMLQGWETGGLVPEKAAT